MLLTQHLNRVLCCYMEVAHGEWPSKAPSLRQLLSAMYRRDTLLEYNLDWRTSSAHGPDTRGLVDQKTEMRGQTLRRDDNSIAGYTLHWNPLSQDGQRKVNVNHPSSITFRHYFARVNKGWSDDQTIDHFWKFHSFLSLNLGFVNLNASFNGVREQPLLCRNRFLISNNFQHLLEREYSV